MQSSVNFKINIFQTVHYNVELHLKLSQSDHSVFLIYLNKMVSNFGIS